MLSFTARYTQDFLLNKAIAGLFSPAKMFRNAFFLGDFITQIAEADA